MTIKIGIQGDRGSTNERACIFFAKEHGIRDYEIQYLIRTEAVLDALNKGVIDYGTFAWESTRGGLVEETQLAIQSFPYRKIDEHFFQLDHALMKRSDIDLDDVVNIYSHHQAIKEHGAFLRSHFKHLELNDEIDTAIAAKKLQSGEYPENSLIIAPIGCAALYDLDVYLEDLPSNEGYKTKILFVKM